MSCEAGAVGRLRGPGLILQMTKVRLSKREDSEDTGCRPRRLWEGPDKQLPSAHVHHAGPILRLCCVALGELLNFSESPYGNNGLVWGHGGCEGLRTLDTPATQDADPLPPPQRILISK